MLICIKHNVTKKAQQAQKCQQLNSSTTENTLKLRTIQKIKEDKIYTTVKTHTVLPLRKQKLLTSTVNDASKMNWRYLFIKRAFSSGVKKLLSDAGQRPFSGSNNCLYDIHTDIFI